MMMLRGWRQSSLEAYLDGEWKTFYLSSRYHSSLGYLLDCSLPWLSVGLSPAKVENSHRYQVSLH
jgi:hypothetical protein